MRSHAILIALIGMFATLFSFSATAEIFIVNTTIDDSDSHDLNPGDGFCNTFDGDCSMRAAIEEANALSGADTIEFSINGTIVLDAGNGEFPRITDQLRIHGDSAPGYPGFSTDLEDAEPSVYVDGEALGLGGETNGLRFDAGISSVRGFGVINFFNGIVLSGSANSVDACYVGVRANETGNGNRVGIFIAGDNSTIGRFSTLLGIEGYGNVISGNEFFGIQLALGSGSKIAGNRIGTRPDGAQVLPNGSGINAASNNNEIGFIHQNGTPVGNIIGGNSGYGIDLGGSDNEIYANYIGVNSDFAQGLGNGLDGIRLNGNDNIVGGIESGFANFISGNRNGIVVRGSSSRNVIAGNDIGVKVGAISQGNLEDGVLLEGGSGTLNELRSNSIIFSGGNGITIEKDTTRVYGNIIGVKFGAGSDFAGNQGDGIRVDSEFNAIGFPDPGFRNTIGYSGGHGINIGNRSNSIKGNFIGTTSASGSLNAANEGDGIHLENRSGSPDQTEIQDNVIAYNGLAGVYMLDGIGSPIFRNSMFSNGGLGIDLAPLGPTVNDPGDADGGPNFLQNYPVILSTIYNNVPEPPELTVNWSVESTATFNGIGSFYLADSAASGEGKTFLRNASISMSGEIVSSVLILPAGVTSGHLVSAVRNQAGNSSEFSPPVEFSRADVLFDDGFEN